MEEPTLQNRKICNVELAAVGVKRSANRSGCTGAQSDFELRR